MPGHRVLVVDDFPDSAELTAMLLRCAGFDANGFRDPGDALTFARAWHPWAAVIDLLMPLQDGHELGRTLREECPYDVHLIALTGMSSERLARRSAELGFRRHLLKSAKPETLVAILRDLEHEESAGHGRAA
jgi:two-component system CheB/CheR fusion protein